MTVTPLLLYCAGGNRKFAQIALDAGFAYGCRSDYTPLFAPVAFADLNWKRPDRERHLAFVAEHRPRLAVAPDVLALDALADTVRYAGELAQHAERVIIVPKAAGVMAGLAQEREPWMVIGYSVPTKYGGADALMVWELTGWPVHLLGGTPQAQLTLARYMQVYSADGNAAHLAARWGSWYDATRNVWTDGAQREPQGEGMVYRAFARSCENIIAAWEHHHQHAARGEGEGEGEG